MTALKSCLETQTSGNVKWAACKVESKKSCVSAQARITPDIWYVAVCWHSHCAVWPACWMMQVHPSGIAQLFFFSPGTREEFFFCSRGSWYFFQVQILTDPSWGKKKNLGVRVTFSHVGGDTANQCASRSWSHVVETTGGPNLVVKVVAEFLESVKDN